MVFSRVVVRIQVSELYSKIGSTKVLKMRILCVALRCLDLKCFLNFLIGAETLVFLELMSHFVSNFVPSSLIFL